MLVDHFHNLNKAQSPYTDELKSILNLLDSKEAFDEISTWDGYRLTPLLSLKKGYSFTNWDKKNLS